jgi:hypothetical protein
MKPVLELYRDIRRLHRKLAPEMKYLGNRYVISEFKLHRNASPDQVKQFIEAWKTYKEDLERQSFQSNPKSLVDSLSPEQLGQLLELKKSVKEIK